MRVLSQFVTSAAGAGHFPATSVPEVAFLGRSNVGKSSLINSLLGEKLAKTSSTPGRTRTINFFAVRRPGQAAPELLFADLPGYGYAKLPRALTAEWPKFIDPYLENRERLALCVVLVDAKIPPQESDRQLLDFLRAYQRKFVVVATKTDRLSGNTLRQSLESLRTHLATDELLAYSTKTGAGRAELWRRIWEAASA